MGWQHVEISAWALMCLLVQHHNLICSFPHLQGGFLPGNLMLDFKEGTEEVAEIREHPCEKLHPQQIRFPPQRKIWDGTI